MKRHRFHKVAFLLFFALYAISPLTYDLSAHSITPLFPSHGSSERSFRSTSLYLIEILFETFSPDVDADSQSSPNRVLINKKSAVHRGRFDLVPQSGNVVVFAAADLTACQYEGITDKRAESIRPQLRKSCDCLPLSSGLSPPRLS
jgi:hypothetical protein